jgi:hypothetical protein
LRTERYIEQTRRWPRAGRHILAQFDDESVVVYQAYRPEIGRFAADHGYFGGAFSYSRMSWIKPNFLWMMYRSGWGTKSGQEVVLAVRIRRSFFDRLLADAVWSSYSDDHYASKQAWEDAVAVSSVRLQWDPDHDPLGTPVERRALQLGLRDSALEAYGRPELLEVRDISAFVATQRLHATTERLADLVTPVEHVYVPADAAVRSRIGL